MRTLFLLSSCAVLTASRISPEFDTLFPATSRITSPSLTPRVAAALFGSTPVTTTPVLPAPPTEFAGATVMPSRGTSEPCDGLLFVGSALASCIAGNLPRVRLTDSSFPLCRTLSLTSAPGARLPMGAGEFARRSLRTASPLTEVMTSSPDSMPALAAGPLA